VYLSGKRYHRKRGRKEEKEGGKQRLLNYQNSTHKKQT
jgi:hypothetical protein